jgi:hypothetical protein
MRCGRGAQPFARTGCGFAVEYTHLRAFCQIKKGARTVASAKQALRYGFFAQQRMIK